MMNKKGFTLIEIIVSIAIIGIIVVGGFSIIGNNFTFIRRSRDMSVDTLLTQQDIELEISDIKNQLKKPGHGLTLSNINIDGVNIGYYGVSKSYNGINYKFNVTPEQFPEYILLKTFSVRATLKTNTTNTFSVYPIISSSALGLSTPDASTYSTHWMLDINQWYVSRPGFNVPVPKGPVNDTSFKYYDYLVANGLDSELGTRYPSFPDDYILLGTETSKTLANLNNFGGRHLIYKVTAAAKSGRLGIPEYSDPIFVNSLNRLDNLVVHLDASMIDPSYKEASNAQHVDNNYRLITWLDLSSGVGVALPTQFGTTTNISTRPLLVDSNIGTEFNGRYVKFESGKSVSLNSQATNSKWIYAFAVVKGDDNRLVFSNGNNSLKIDEIEARNLVDNWKLINKEYRSNSNNFQIGNDKIDIAELIIYAFDSQLDSTDFENLSKSIYNLVESKYLPLDTIWEIDKVLPIETTIYVDTPYIAPNFANALLTNGTKKYVPVVWVNGSAVDTSTARVATLNGYASADSSKTVTLTLNIINRPVESVVIDPNEIAMDINQAPFALNVIVLPVNATVKTLTWTSANSSIVQVNNGILTPNAVGRATVTATSVDDPSKKASVIVTVFDATTAYLAVVKAEGSLLQVDHDAAMTLVVALPNSAEKTALKARLVNVKAIIDAIVDLQSLDLIVSKPTNTRPTITLISDYTWTSSRVSGTTGYINVAGTTGTIYRPNRNGPYNVDLTATVIVSGKTLTRVWVVTIPRGSANVIIGTGSTVKVTP